ncbi:TcfC E-set like domain-containing protein [Vibrio harveyi]|uniref:TcfC E-set like domain-containing protein n=1 Tax=Vibrio harveyi TaxID=669 RepID=UPI003CF38454
MSLKHIGITIFLVLFVKLAKSQGIENEMLLVSNETDALASIASEDGRYSKLSLIRSSDKSYFGFFDLIEKNVEVTVVGSSGTSVNLKGRLSFFKAQIDETEIDALERFLITNGVNEEGVEEISGLLVRGVNASRECKGKKSDCLVFSPEFVVVVDYYNDSLRLFVPDKWFKTNEQKIILEPVVDNLLVSNWYGSMSYTDEASYFVRSENIYGFGKGYIKYDFNTSDYATDIGQFNYNYDAREYSFTAGVISNTQRLGAAGQNSLLNDRFLGIELSNQKLLEVNNYDARNIEFFSPSDGVLLVYRANGELIYQSNIQSGKNSVPYSFLPYGNYVVTYEVKKEDSLVFRGESFVSNSDAFDVSEYSTYTRVGVKKTSVVDEQNKYDVIIDTGLSVPLFQQHSLTGSVSLIEDESFIGFGYNANIDDYRVSFKYSLGEHSSRLNADLYSQLFNFTIANTDIRNDEHSYLGDEDSLLISLGAAQSYNFFSIGANVSYNKLGDYEYLSYNVNNSYSFKNGISIYALYSGGDFQNMFSIGVSLPISSQTNYGMTYTVNQGDFELNNQISSNYRVNDQLTLNGGVSHRYEQEQDNSIDAYINGNYRNDAMTGTLGVRSQRTGVLTYNGSFSTTAYATANDLYFKDARVNSSSAIEVRSFDENNPLNGKIELYNKVSGRKDIEMISNNVLLETPSYSQVIVDYEFDNDEFALSNISLERRTSVDLLPGKIQYIRVNQQPIGNVLVVSDRANTSDISCSGQACVDERGVNSKVVKFRVKPDQEFVIMRDNQICFEGAVEHGETKIGICSN